jgi:hypothetical protein
MSDTPRTDEQINGKPCTRFAILDGDSLRDALVASDFARQLERELNAANSIIRQQQLLDEENLALRQRIKRLENAINRAANRFFADGPDGQTAAEMLKILEEVMEAKP